MIQRLLMVLALGVAPAIAAKTGHRPMSEAPDLPLTPASQQVVDTWLAKAAPLQARLTAISPDTTVAANVAERVAVDQGLRELMYPSPTRDLSPGDRVAADSHIWKYIAAIDQANTRYLRSVLPADGWFRIKRDGRQLASNAWLLVQHSPDEGLQRQVLAAMKPLVASGDARGADYALLYDRTEMFAGRPQYYGSQFCCRDGHRQPEPIRDAAHVDARRKAMGLDPLAHYAATMNALGGC